VKQETGLGFFICIIHCFFFHSPRLASEQKKNSEDEKYYTDLYIFVELYRIVVKMRDITGEKKKKIII